MAREGISYEQVAAAADALVGAGQQPSIRNVREALGTGSPNTVHRHLTTWRQARPVAQGAAYELPADLVNSFGRELARGAAAARAEVESELVQAQQEAAELAATGEGLEVERDELAAQVVALTTERDTALATAAERGEEIARLVEQVQREQQAAEGARIELATARLKIESQVEQLGELRAAQEAAQKALADAQAGRQAAEQRAAVLEAQEAAQKARGDDLARRLEQAEQREQQAAQEAKSAARDASTARIAEQAAQARIEAAEREASNAKQALADAREAARKARDEAAELRGRLAALELGEAGMDKKKR